ncbi:MAG: DUF924 family protein, partial [Methyloligellaceae bacterium]
VLQTRNTMTESSNSDSAKIVNFWISAGPEKWFEKDTSFDLEIAEKFGDLVEPAVGGHLDDWLATAEGALGLILLLDQFPRNLYRDSDRAFQFDSKALAVSDEALSRNHDQAYQNPVRRFFYLPYMHSENLGHQDHCIELCTRANDEVGVKFAEIHADIIRKFGRFPHRNKVLGRSSSPEEIQFLEDGGFAG